MPAERKAPGKPAPNKDLAAIWVTECTSIEIHGPIAIITFSEMRPDNAGSGERHERVRLAFSTAVLGDIALRVGKLKIAAQAMNEPKGSA
jgi:hypothetical protein